MVEGFLPLTGRLDVNGQFLLDLFLANVLLQVVGS